MKKIKAETNTPFTIALDLNKEKTGRYSPNRGEFSGYVIDSKGKITKFFQGDLRNRAKSQEVLAAIKEASGGSGTKEGSDTKEKGSNTKQGSESKVKQGSDSKGSAKKGSGSR